MIKIYIVNLTLIIIGMILTIEAFSGRSHPGFGIVGITFIIIGGLRIDDGI